MRIKTLQVVLLFFALIFFHHVAAQEKQWVPLTGADSLRKFMSDLTVERVMPDGRVSRGVYAADGSGVLFQWGVKFPRKWEVRGEDQVCIISQKSTLCYGIEQNTADPNLFRSYDVSTNQWVEYRIVEGRATITGKPARRGDNGGAAEASASELAAELTNPNTALGILTTLYDYTTFDGTVFDASKQSAQAITFQPSLPYPLGEGRNLFFRPAIPLIIEQPVYDEVSGEFLDQGVELGDIGYDASMGFSFEVEGGKNIIVAGFSGSIPTATDKTVGSDQWLLGPEFGLTAVRKWGSVGLLVYHQWDIAGDDTFDTNFTGGQYTYNINLKDGWQITGSPIWSYDHEADSDNALTLPLAIGIAKTSIFNGRPWTMSIEYWNYVATPDVFGPEHQVRISIAPIVPLPWKGQK